MKHYTNGHEWASGPFAHEAPAPARDWRNWTFVFVLLCIGATVPSFAVHMVEVTQYDRENSFKVGGTE